MDSGLALRAPRNDGQSNPFALIPIPAVDTVPRDSTPRESLI